MAEEIAGLKRQSGGDISISGSGILVRSLLGDDLLDELRLMVHPVVVASGKRLFEEGGDRKELELVDSKAFSTGVVLPHLPADGESKLKPLKAGAETLALRPARSVRRALAVGVRGCAPWYGAAWLALCASMALRASFLFSAPVISLIDAFAHGWTLLPIDSRTLVILCTQADQRGALIEVSMIRLLLRRLASVAG